jgi:hypothetical protein
MNAHLVIIVSKLDERPPANLPDDAYENIGRGVRAIARGYRDAFDASKGTLGK